MRIIDAVSRYVARKATRLEQMRDMAVATGAAEVLCESETAARMLPGMIASCQGCRDADACRGWLMVTDGPECPPPFCANAKLFERLAIRT